MAEHYFTKDPKSPHDVREFEAQLRGRSFTFATDSGVFSKSGVDAGTKLLIEAVDLPPVGQEPEGVAGAGPGRDEVGRGVHILDLGCGYGPIGIALAGFVTEGSTVVMSDVNRRALELTRMNAERNLGREFETGDVKLEVVESDGFGSLGDRQFDMIVSNPPIRAGKQLLFELIEGARERLKPGGSLYIVAQTKQGAKSLRAKMQEVFGNVAEPAKGGGFRVMRSIRRW